MGGDTDTVRVWLVERTFSEDKPNLLVLTYATTDGERYFMRERVITGTGETEVTATLDADPDDLGTVDEEAVEQYAAEATRMSNVHDPDDPI